MATEQHVQTVRGKSNCVADELDRNSQVQKAIVTDRICEDSLTNEALKHAVKIAI